MGKAFINLIFIIKISIWWIIFVSFLVQIFSNTLVCGLTGLVLSVIMVYPINIDDIDVK